MAGYDIIIVGGGASGLFCANALAARGLRFLLLESRQRPGAKLGASGGGRANFTNLNMAPEMFLSRPEPLFCANALRKFSPEDFMAEIAALGLPFEERDSGRIFLKCGATTLVDRLIKGLPEDSLRSGEEIIEAWTDSEHFRLRTRGRQYESRTLLLAVGSPAVPGLSGPPGSWSLAVQLGHSVNPPVPALSPLLESSGSVNFAACAGISVPINAFLKLTDKKSPVISGSCLCTHAGLSGPAILSASLYWEPGAVLHVDFLPETNFEELLDQNERGKMTPLGLLSRIIPRRLARFLLPPELAPIHIAKLGRSERNRLGSLVNDRTFESMAPAGLEKAEVCKGGVPTNEIHPASMESRLVSNLHFAGEMVDVTGRLGGYNLHWAWASAMRAADAIIKKIGQ